MNGQLGLSELFVISWVSAVEGCPLSGVPLYITSAYVPAPSCVVNTLSQIQPHSRDLPATPPGEPGDKAFVN